jgi:hypothetical protein
LTTAKQTLDVMGMKKFKIFLCLLTLLSGCGTDKGRDDPNPTEGEIDVSGTVDNSDSYLGTKLEFDDNATLAKILDTAIQINKLQFREVGGLKIYYSGSSISAQSPHTGFAKLIRNKKVQELWELKDGNKHGIFMSWHKTGQKKTTGHYNQGKWDDMWTTWYANGITKYEQLYKDGKLISAKANMPNGQVCPVTNLSRGTGIRVFYNEDGTESKRLHYKNSKVAKP